MITRADLVAEALSWRGTPVVQIPASLKGKATDCRGMIAGIARELGMPQAKSIYATMRYRGIDPDQLIEGMGKVFEPGDLETMQPGDVLLLRMHVPPEPRPGRPRHLAMLVSDTQIIHAYGRAHDVVVTNDLAPALRLWKLHSVWRWPGVD